MIGPQRTMNKRQNVFKSPRRYRCCSLVQEDKSIWINKPGRRVPSPSIMETRTRAKGSTHQQTQLNDDEDEYAIVNITILETFINHLVNDHSSRTPTGSEPCKKAKIVLSKHRSIIYLNAEVSCKNCSFKSPRVNFYRTMPNTFKIIISAQTG